MTAGPLGFLVVVAVYFAASSALSLLIAAALPWLERRLEGRTPQRRAASLLFLALAPAAGGLLAAALIALPAWIRHEPRGKVEEPGPVLVALAGAGLALAARRLGAAARDQVRTARLVAGWTKAGHELPGHPLPAFRVSCDFPLAAVVGVMKPRLVLSESLLRELDPVEVRAVVEHEVAHAGVRENLRRLALRASPDLLAVLPAGARLRELFDHASEAAADRVASTRVPPLVLAHALLKTAALVPAGQRLDLSLAAFHREGGIAARVMALLEPGAGRPEGRGEFRLGLALALLASVLLVVGQAESALVHGALERLVHLFA